MFADDLTWLTSGPGWAITTFVLGIAITVYFAVISFRDRKIRYALRTNNLMRDVTGSTMPGATLTFADYDPPIANLSATRLALWNAGRGGVKAEDVVKEKPLIIRLSEPGTVILSIGIIQYNRPDNLNKFRCEKAPDRLSASIDFEFMDHNQGIVVQIFHTAVSHKGMSVEGYVKGMGEPKYKVVPAGNQTAAPLASPSPKKRNVLTNRRIRVFMGWLVFMVPFLLAGFFGSGAVKQNVDDRPQVSSGAAMLIALAIGALGLWPFAYFMLRPGVPKELSVFEEDF